MQQHIDMIKGFGASAFSFAAVAISRATANEWLQMLSLSCGIALCCVTIAEKIHNWNRSRPRRRKHDDN